MGDQIRDFLEALKTATFKKNYKIAAGGGREGEDALLERGWSRKGVGLTDNQIKVISIRPARGPPGRGRRADDRKRSGVGGIKKGLCHPPRAAKKETPIGMRKGGGKAGGEKFHWGVVGSLRGAGVGTGQTKWKTERGCF